MSTVPLEPQPERIKYSARIRTPEGHKGQMALYSTQRKRVIIRAGRRGGKTTGAAMKAVLAFLAGKRVLYAAPTLDQVQKFWKEVKRSLDEPLVHGVYRKNETEKVVEEVGTESRIR